MHALGLALQTGRAWGRRGLRSFALGANLGHIVRRDEVFTAGELCGEATATNPPVRSLVVHTERVCR